MPKFYDRCGSDLLDGLDPDAARASRWPWAMSLPAPSPKSASAWLTCAAAVVGVGSWERRAVGERAAAAGVRQEAAEENAARGRRAVGWHAVDASPWEEGDTALVGKGCERIYRESEASTGRSEFALTFGAHHAINPVREDMAARVAEIAYFDEVIEAIAAGPILPAGIITKMIRFDKVIEDGFDALINDKEDQIKVMFAMEAETAL